MENIKYYKKAFHNFGIFLIFVLVFGILIIPCYSGLMTYVKNRTMEQFDGKVRQILKMEENEINLQVNVLKNVSNEQDFKILSNPPAYGYSVGSAKWFESRESVQKSYSVLKSLVSMQDKSFMLFRNSDIMMDTSGAVDDFRASYDTLWRMTANGVKCSWDFVSAQFFYKENDGQFNNAFAYHDISTGETYELVYLLTLSATEEGVYDSVFVACYDAEKIIDSLGFADDTNSILITTDDDKKIYCSGQEYDIAAYDSCCESENLNLKFYYSVSDECLKKQMEPINFFLLIIILTFVLFGFIATMGMAIVERKGLKKILDIVDGVSDIEYSADDDQIKYLETVVHKMHTENTRNRDVLKNLIYSKLLNFKLSDSEKELVADDFSAPVFIVMLKNTIPHYNDMEFDVKTFIKENGAEVMHLVRLNRAEFVVFAKMSNVIRDIVDDMVVTINKKRKTDIRGVSAICNDINEVTVAFDKMRKNIQYLEYGSVKFLKDYEETQNNEEFKSILAKSRQLYEIIRSGNDFEAKRIVYEQWYKITQGEFNVLGIEPLFFSQTSVLSQIATENKINILVPKFDSEKDAVSIAFEITECIEQLCEKIKGDEKKEDVRVSQIIEYIGQRFCDSSFYMPELVGRFELSDRAIVQMLKKNTGDNFSNYLGKLRIEKARTLLSDTNIPVSEVATSSGFDSANSLYKAFKKFYGVSPSTYRESRKADKQQD